MPNTLAPLGMFSKPFLGAAKLLAATETFRTTCGVSTPAEAMNFIHWPRLLTPSSVIPIPCAMLGFDEANQFRMPKFSKAGGTLMLALNFPLNTEHTRPEDQLFDYTNQVGVILREMLQLANTVGPDGNYWNLCGDDSPIENYLPPSISDPKDFYGVAATESGGAPEPIPETFIEFFASIWMLPWSQ